MNSQRYFETKTAEIFDEMYRAALTDLSSNNFSRGEQELLAVELAKLRLQNKSGYKSR